MMFTQGITITSRAQVLHQIKLMFGEMFTLTSRWRLGEMFTFVWPGCGVRPLGKRKGKKKTPQAARPAGLDERVLNLWYSKLNKIQKE